MIRRRSYHSAGQIYVRCPHCVRNIDENEVKFLNIEEDEMGKDVMTFICPVCKTKQKSHRFS